MEDIAGWIAPIATMIAAMMTAANLGPRITGWGFVIFTIGSIAWSTVAIVTGQANLLWANGFLTLVNLVGIWRWLGREAKRDDGAKAAVRHSDTADVPALFAATDIVGRPVIGPHGDVIGHGAGAMAECGSGRIAYLLVGEGGVAGVGERLHAIDWGDVRATEDGLIVPIDAAGLMGLPEVAAGHWPDRAPAPLPTGQDASFTPSRDRASSPR